jgi:hypothetical protein
MLLSVGLLERPLLVAFLTEIAGQVNDRRLFGDLPLVIEREFRLKCSRNSVMQQLDAGRRETRLPGDIVARVA